MSVVSPPSAGDDYQSFLEEYHHINEEGNNRTTVLSRKFEESQEMHTLSDRLADTRLIVDDIVAVMKNKKATKKSQNEALKHLEQSIGPLLDVAADLLRKSAHSVAPIAGGGYAHRRMRVSKMKELNIPTKPSPESSLLLVDKFLQQHKPATATPVHVRSSKRTRNGNLIHKEDRDDINEDNADEDDHDNAEINTNKPRKHGNLADGPHRTTTANYKALLSVLKNNDGLKLIGKSNPKTNARWTAEHSDIAVFALMVLIACTHFYVVAEDNADWDKSVEELPYDIKEFYLMMKEIHGGRPIRVVDPSYVINEDCQTQYLTLGRQDDGSNSIGLVSSASLVNSRTRSTYHREDSNKMSGMRVKRHLIMNARGDTAPAVYSFNGLTDAEMPGNQDIIIWAVKGLCIGGYGASSSTEVGYVVFKRGVKGSEKKQFRWMREDVLIPWIRLLRRKYHDVSEDDKVAATDIEHHAVLWCDGDASQIDTIVSPEGIQCYADNNITVNKHNASRSGSEQMCDLCPAFMESNAMNKKSTMMHVPVSQNCLKRALTDLFKDFSQRNLLRLTKTAAIIDYLTKQPKILTQTLTAERLVKGPVENGMVDKMHGVFPVFKKVMATSKKIPSLKLYNLFKEKLPEAVKYCLDNDLCYLDDEDFMKLGFSPDIDAYGKIKIRDATISQENQQRCKCMTSLTEVEKRKEYHAEIDDELQRKEQLKELKKEQIISADG